MKLYAFMMLVVMISASPINIPDGEDGEENVHDMIMKVNEAMEKRGIESENNVDDKINKGNEDLEGLEEGDIIPDKRTEKRSAISYDRYKWPGNTVPYVFNSSVPPSFCPIIEAAISEMNAKTCVLIRPKITSDTGRYLVFRSTRECSSEVGRTGSNGPQYITISYGCHYKGIIQHLLMHALGFYHEQSRYDRDNYVQIILENVKDGKEDSFNKRPQSYTSLQGLTYDYGSLMHYGKTAFSKNGKATIISTTDPNQYFGQRDGMSQLDIKGINIKYGCPNGVSLTPAPTPTPTPTPNQNANIDANFDHRHGNWQIGGWTIIAGATPSPHTGPTTDVSGTGKYAYFETSNPAKAGDKVTMEIVISATLASCAINFAYHMYGSSMGTLQLIVVKDDNPTVVWEKAGQQGPYYEANRWRQAAVIIGAGTNIEVKFVGIKGSSWKSDMAVDEISFSACL